MVVIESRWATWDLIRVSLRICLTFPLVFFNVNEKWLSGSRQNWSTCFKYDWAQTRKICSISRSEKPLLCATIFNDAKRRLISHVNGPQ